MKYAFFPVDAESEINEFLEQHKDEIIQSTISSGNVSFLYHTDSLEQVRVEGMIKAVDEFINQRYTEVLSREVDELYHNSMSVTGGKDSEQAAAQAKAQKLNLCKQIEIARGIRKKLVDRSWEGLAATGISV